MPQGYKQPLDTTLLKELERVLTAFTTAHLPAGNPGLQGHIDSAEMKVQEAMETALVETNTNIGAVVIGAAIALSKFIHSAPMKQKQVY